MKIVIELPREAEGKVRLNDKDREIIIEPRFTQPGSVRPISYITVEGKAGARKRFVLSVSGSTGRLLLQEVGDVESLFDKPEGERQRAAEESAPAEEASES